MAANILSQIRQEGFSFESLARQIPVLGELRQVPQNPEYHGEGDVYTHTAMLCGELTAFPEFSKLPPKDQELLFLAGAFHDLGKLTATKLEDGKWTSPKHTIVGAKMFRELVYREAEKFGLTFQEREQVSALIRGHGLPVWLWTKKRPEYELMKTAERVDLRLLYLLSKADVRGRIGDGKERMEEDVEHFWECAKELGLETGTFSFANPFTRFQYFHKSELWQGAQLYDTTEFDVWILSGLPLAGKDTWAGGHGEGIAVISLDAIREELHISPASGSAKVAAAANERAKALLRRREPFIWNATNIIEETRQKICGMCSAYGARVHFVYLEAPYRELQRRNEKRVRYIPEPVLEDMIHKFEPPAPWEGYTVEYQVSE